MMPKDPVKLHNPPSPPKKKHLPVTFLAPVRPRPAPSSGGR